ncbi:hypothetical protein Tco_0100594 [Tanacetum coccineum]
MEAYLAPKQPVQVNKISSSCEICNGPHDTQYCMENPEQALLIMRLRVPTKREVSSSLQHKDQETSAKPLMLRRTRKTLTGHELNPSQVLKVARSPPTPLVTKQWLRKH